MTNKNIYSVHNESYHFPPLSLLTEFDDKTMISLRDVTAGESEREDMSKFCVGIGRYDDGTLAVVDWRKRILTGSGRDNWKDYFIDTFLAGLLLKAHPDELKLILIDIEGDRLVKYNGIPHLLTPVITEPQKAANALRWAIMESDRRRKESQERDCLEGECCGKEKNKNPYIIVVVNEIHEAIINNKEEQEYPNLLGHLSGRVPLMVITRAMHDIDRTLLWDQKIYFAENPENIKRWPRWMKSPASLTEDGSMLIPDYNDELKPAKCALAKQEEIDKILDFLKKQDSFVNYDDSITQSVQKLPAEYIEKEEKEYKWFSVGMHMLMDKCNMSDSKSRSRVSAAVLQECFKLDFQCALDMLADMEKEGLIEKESEGEYYDIINELLFISEVLSNIPPNDEIMDDFERKTSGN